MPKDIPVSNGSLLVNFDSDYQIRDIFFPHIGQENHSSGRCFRFGVWVDGQFFWVGPGWEKELKYHDNSLVTDVVLKNDVLGLALRCHDTVDVDLNVYVKKIELINTENKARQVRLFFTHDFSLYGNDIGGTAYYDPRTRSIMHYKIKRYFLINCCINEQAGVHHYSCGRNGEGGSIAEDMIPKDGMLDGSPSSWGSPHSSISIWVDLPAKESTIAYYWIAAGTKHHEVAQLNMDVQKITPQEMINRSTKYWEIWLHSNAIPIDGLAQTEVNIFERSLLILRTQIDNQGAIIAANDSDIIRFGKDTYSYMWGRDGAFVSVALAKAGYSHICMKYFDFCARVLTDEGYLFQHYNPDGSLASNWHSWVVDGQEVLPIQEDSTALILWAIWIHYQEINDIEYIKPLYDTLIKKAANFLVGYRDLETLLPLPSYDLWEERYAVHAHTVASVVAGLRAAANFATLFQDISLAETYNTVANQMVEGIKKYLYDPELKRYARSGTRTDNGYQLNEVVDISLLSLVTLGVIDPNDDRMIATVQVIKDQLWLKTPTGGCARYQGDRYQLDIEVPVDIPGNPWFISTLWLGEYFIDCASNREELEIALPYIEWCGHNALVSGILAEQVHPINGSPLCVSPLTWSHSAFIWTALKYSNKFKLFKTST